MIFSELVEQFRVVRQTFKPLRLTRWQLVRLLAAQIWREMTPAAKLSVAAFAILLIGWVVTWLSRPKSLERLGLPMVGKSKGRKFDFQQVITEAAKKHPESPYLISAFGHQYVVYPSSCFNEVKRIPETVASAQEYFKDFFHEQWTSIGRETPELLRTLSVNLSRAIPALVHDRQQECATTCRTAIGDCGDWKEVNLYSSMQQIVASTNASAFVGRELGTSRKWIQAVERLPMAMAIGIISLAAVPRPIKPFIEPLVFLPVLKLRWDMTRMLTPVIEGDMKEYESSTDKKDLQGPKRQGKVPLTGWLMERYGPARGTVQQIVSDYILTSFESTPSSAGTLYFIMAELAADPELVDLLRDEIKTVAQDGKLPTTHLYELHKMDSVMRESSRMNPFNFFSLYRKLKTPLKLTIGPELPAGSIICVDAHHINNSAALWDRPDVFDGLRHHRARQIPANENRFQFSGLGADSPGWGDGGQACPGRIFANNTIKIILTHLLTHYEFKLRPGEGKPRKDSMPNGSMAPDLKAMILFRARKSES